MTIASLVTEPSHSIINQSLRSRESEDPLNGDGFGVAWYANDCSPEPAVFRSMTPAWSNSNLLDLARVTRSTHVLAHVRAATPGLPVTELNCHPFVRGTLTLMHNGEIGGFSTIRRRLLESLSDSAFESIRGTTDSEHLFGVLLHELERSAESDPGDRLAGALWRAMRRVTAMARDAGASEHSYLNVAVSDGGCSIACRCTTDGPENASSLHMHTGLRYLCEGGVCRMIDAHGGRGAVIVSSEPLSMDEGWRDLPANHLLIIREDRGTELRSCALAA